MLQLFKLLASHQLSKHDVDYATMLFAAPHRGGSFCLLLFSKHPLHKTSVLTAKASFQEKINNYRQPKKINAYLKVKSFWGLKAFVLC
jgi:hypothetical protein